MGSTTNSARGVSTLNLRQQQRARLPVCVWRGACAAAVCKRGGAPTSSVQGPPRPWGRAAGPAGAARMGKRGKQGRERGKQLSARFEALAEQSSSSTAHQQPGGGPQHCSGAHNERHPARTCKRAGAARLPTVGQPLPQRCVRTPAPSTATTTWRCLHRLRLHRMQCSFRTAARPLAHAAPASAPAVCADQANSSAEACTGQGAQHASVLCTASAARALDLLYHSGMRLVPCCSTTGLLRWPGSNGLRGAAAAAQVQSCTCGHTRSLPAHTTLPLCVQKCMAKATHKREPLEWRQQATWAPFVYTPPPVLLAAYSRAAGGSGPGQQLALLLLMGRWC